MQQTAGQTSLAAEQFALRAAAEIDLYVMPAISYLTGPGKAALLGLDVMSEATMIKL